MNGQVDKPGDCIMKSTSSSSAHISGLALFAYFMNFSKRMKLSLNWMTIKTMLKSRFLFLINKSQL